MKKVLTLGHIGIGVEARAIALITMLPYHYPPPSVPRLDHIITKDNLGIEIILIDHHLEMDALIFKEIEKDLGIDLILIGMNQERNQNELIIQRDYQHFIITAPAVIEDFVMNLKSVDVCIFERIHLENSQLPCTNCHPWQFVANRSQHPP